MIDDKETVSPPKPRYPNRHLHFLLFTVGCAAAFFSPLRDLVRTSLRSDYDSYIPFIPFITAYLLYTERQRIFSPDKTFIPGLLAVGIGVLLLFSGRNQADLPDHRDYLAIMTASLVMIWIGGFAFWYGMASARAAAFPLLFLFFFVPIPGLVLDKIILFLQVGSTEVSYGFLQLAGVPVARDGFVFHLPTIDVEVAKQCSGIRSSLALVITGALAAWFFLRTGWSRMLLMGSIIPIVVVKNGLRIFTLSALGVYWDERILASDLHAKGGFIFFIIALFLVWGVIALLKKAEGSVEARRPEERIS